MKRFVKIINISVGASIILFTGCANPSFQPNNKKIVFIDGNAYRTPYGAGNTPHKYTSSAEDQERLAVYNKYGMNCKLGDILWIENYTAKEAQNIYNKNGKIAGYTYVGQVSKESKSGCVSPLTEKEYNFYLAKEMDTSENARARANYAAAIAPRTVNVQHSGSVTQNVNLSGTMNHNVNVTNNPYTYYP